MSTVIEDIVHELIDVVSGKQARLNPGRAAEMHDSITPGYTDEPMSQEDIDRLNALQARQDRIEAKAANARAERDRASHAGAPGAPGAPEHLVVTDPAAAVQPQRVPVQSSDAG